MILMCVCASCRPPRKRQKRDDPEPVTGDGQDAQMSDAERALMTAPTLELGDTTPDDPVRPRSATVRLFPTRVLMH